MVHIFYKRVPLMFHPNVAHVTWVVPWNELHSMKRSESNLDFSTAPVSLQGAYSAYIALKCSVGLVDK